MTPVFPIMPESCASRVEGSFWIKAGLGFRGFREWSFLGLFIEGSGHVGFRGLKV